MTDFDALAPMPDPTREEMIATLWSIIGTRNQDSGFWRDKLYVLHAIINELEVNTAIRVEQ